MSHSHLDNLCLLGDKSIILFSSFEQNYHPCTADIIILNRTGVLFWNQCKMGNCFLPEPLSSAFSPAEITNWFSISGFLTHDSILLATHVSLHFCYLMNPSAISCIFSIVLVTVRLQTKLAADRQDFQSECCHYFLFSCRKLHHLRPAHKGNYM